jgi:hypothetical protein
VESAGKLFHLNAATMATKGGEHFVDVSDEKLAVKDQHVPITKSKGKYEGIIPYEIAVGHTFFNKDKGNKYTEVLKPLKKAKLVRALWFQFMKSVGQVTSRVLPHSASKGLGDMAAMQNALARK